MVGESASALMGAGRQGAMLRGVGVGPPPVAGSAISSGSGERAKWKLLHELERPRVRAQRRAEIQRALTGGWPSGVACMESNALWFRAMMAAKRIAAEQEEAEDWFTKLRRRVLGEDYT